MITKRWVLVGIGLTLLLAIGQPGCREGGPTNKPADPAASQPTNSGTMKLTSSAFAPGDPIPKKYTGEGENVSPPLAWTGVPAGTKQFALIMDDPDARGDEPWVHWVLYQITPNVQSLPESMPPGHAFCGLPIDLSGSVPTIVKSTDYDKFLTQKNPRSAWEGGNSWGMTGYKGPMPPPGSGIHHYHFKLYALDEPAPIHEGTSKRLLLEDISGHILATAELVGTYERK